MLLIMNVVKPFTLKYDVISCHVSTCVLKKNKKQKANQGLNLELLSNAWRRHYFLPEQKTDSQHFTVPQQALMAHKTCHVVATIIGAKKRWHSVSIFPDVYPRPPVRLNRIFIGLFIEMYSCLYRACIV